MAGSLSVLLVEDSADDAKLLLLELRHVGKEITHQRVDTAAAMQEALKTGSWDIVIADYSLPQFSGMAALAMVQAQRFDTPFILVSGVVGEESAVQAMKAGASDYLFKGNLKRLAPAVEREIREAEERRTARRIEEELKRARIELAATEGLAASNRALQTEVGNRQLVQRALEDLNETLEQRVADRTAAAESQLRELEESESRFRQLAENTNDVFWMTTVELDHVIYVSPRYEEIWGRTCASLCEKTTDWLDAVEPDDRRLVCEARQTIVSSGRMEIEYRIRRPDGAIRWIRDRALPVRDQTGRIYRIAGIAEDFTDRKLAEQQVVDAKEAAEAANRAKSEFLANMSHEIRTPMTAIMGFADMILQPNQNEAGRVECVQIIRRNGTYLLELINQILDLSKIEEGLMTVESIPCEITALLADVVAIVRPRAAEKGLEFEVVIRCPLPRFIQTDPLRLRQILVNLLGNAIKFTLAGKVTMTICSEGPGPGHVLCVEVIDSGIGMTPEQLEGLFRPFSQADESITRKFGGTGLGLTISRQLAHLLGGEIEVKSKPGVGSTFTMRVDGGSFAGVEMLIDLNEAMLPSVAPADKWQDIPLHGRILLAEDGRDNQRLLSTHLRVCGAEVVIAENGRIAVDLAVKDSFDLILMDMQMPVTDGYTATAELRRRGFTTPIIALTANAMAEDRRRCMACGCTDYLSKPIDRDILLKTVNQYLGKTPAAKLPIKLPAATVAADTAATITSSMTEYPGMMKIITEFVDGLPGEVRKMTDFLEQNDLASLRRVVHQLRGAGGGYGFDPVTEPAVRAEESIKAGKALESITAEIESLIDVVRRIEGYREPGPVGVESCAII